MRGGPTRIQPVGGGDGKNPDIPTRFCQKARGGDRFGRDAALIGNDNVAVGAGLPPPIGAVDRALAESVYILARRLFQRPRTQTEIDRAAGFVAQPSPLVRIAFAVALHVAKRPLHDQSKLIDIGRLEGCKAVLAHADERRADRLMRAAFRGQRNAGWCSRDDEPRILITDIVQRIEAARNERIVNRADRQ